MANLVAIVGRPNVGKSTLFNRLTQSRRAIVSDTAGTTRDRQYGKCSWNGREFSVVDTGGWVVKSDDIFEDAIRKQVLVATEEADLVLFLVDVNTGLTDWDEDVALILRRAKLPVILVANKVDNSAEYYQAAEFYKLGLGDPQCISAATGGGTGDLLDIILDKLQDNPEEAIEEDIPRFAVVGRPNAGKSSIINAFIGEDRNIVTEIAGTTRDSIYTRYDKFGFDFYLVDTAGIRRKNKVSEDLEFYSVMRSIRAIENSDVCILMLDATRYAWRHRTAEEVYPLFSLVYHDYAVTYGSDCEQSLGIDDFRWQMGLHFVWGSQLCYSSYLIEDPGKTAHDVFTRDLAQAWHRSGYKYLTGGQGIEIAQTATEKEAGNAPAAVISRKVTVPLKDTMGKPFNWEGPAVPASAWKAYDNTIGFTMANISGKAQKIELIVGRKALNSQYETLWRTWPLPAVKLGKISDRTKMNLVLPADTCMILEIRDDSAPVIRPLTEQPSLTMAADSKGVFPVLNVKAGKLYGTDSAYTLHQNNSVKVCNAAGTPLKAKTHHWRYVEGIGGPRTPDYRTFHLLKDSGCTLTACKSASVRIISEIMTAEVELDKTAELKGAGKVLLADRIAQNPNGKSVRREIEAGREPFWEYDLPKESYQDGTLKVRWEVYDTLKALAVSEVWIMKKE